MLIPLGVLALGAVFSGMVWYKVFFGNEDALRNWFGMEAAHHEVAEAGHGTTEGAATGTVPAAEGEATETADAPEAAADAHAAHGTAPKGALYLSPDNHMLHAAHEVPTWVKLSPFVAMLLGLALSWLFYIRKPELPGRLAAAYRPIYNFLLNKWYFDELYHTIFVKPALWLGRFFWKKGDGAVIDASINGVAMGIIPTLTRTAQRLQTGHVYSYAFAMVIGLALLITWMTIGGGAE